MTASTAFDLTGPLPSGRLALEASAGTGKTFSLSSLVVRYVAESGTTVDQFLVVTFTRAAANELRDRTRAALQGAQHALSGGAPAANQTWMQVLLEPASEIPVRLARVEQALARFDDLTITTIHGFCHLTLTQLGLRGGADPQATLVENMSSIVGEVCRDLVVTELADDPGVLNTTRGEKKIISPRQAETELVSIASTMLNNPGAAVEPSSSTADDRARRWLRLAATAGREIARRQRSRGEIGYDSLVTGLHAALADERLGTAVAQQLGQRHTVVLVDEFQDTDDRQWQVFDRAFSQGTLITVGDPKQAIYRFRGADVHAYLRSVQDVPLQRLSTNFRSDARVLEGIAEVFKGATLGHEAIAFSPVEARPDAPATSLRRDGHPLAGAAVQLRVVQPHESLRTRGGRELGMPHVRTLVLADLVAQTIDLLDHVEIDELGGPRRVRPGDIAVLVPSHADAENVAEAMRRAGIPSVRTRTGSVLATAAAEQWRLLLAALAQPHQAPVVRAAALGWFLQTPVADLAPGNPGADATLAVLQERAATMADRVRTAGVAAFYDEQKQETTLLRAVLARQGGDRELTDLDHIAELLADELHGTASDPGQVLRVLDELIRTADERGESAMRRIDSDAHAVTITTIHAAKGLEYPIVLLPFSFKAPPFVRTPYSYVGAGGERTLDVASSVQWDGGLAADDDATSRSLQETRKQSATEERDGDELRLLYVALTRAKHRAVVWWASSQYAATSALGRVLLDRLGDAVLNTPTRRELKPRGGIKIDKPGFFTDSPDTALDKITWLASSSNGTVDLAMVSHDSQPVQWDGRAQAIPPTLALADRRGRQVVADGSWQRWSFSRIGSTLESIALGAGRPLATHGEDRAAERGGNDEPADPAEEIVVRDETVETAPQLQLAVGPIAHLAPIPGGTRFGTFVHGVLEHVDFSSPSIEADLASLVVEHAHRDGLDVPTGDVTAGLLAAIETPMGPLFGGRSLRTIPARDRLAELTFDFPIASRFTAGSIGDALLATLHPSDRLRPFALQLAGDLRTIDMSGWMHGSIDAVFRLHDDPDPTDPDPTDPDPDDDPDDTGEIDEHPFRYVIVDYKTNRVHELGTADPVAAYHPVRLVPAMEHSRYPLQALIYSVALHRYLRWRLGDRYVPHDHLGGVGYLFVRGMVGPATPTVHGVPHGVFSWRPPTTTILELDRLFGRELA